MTTGKLANNGMAGLVKKHGDKFEWFQQYRPPELKETNWFRANLSNEIKYENTTFEMKILSWSLKFNRLLK